MCVRACGESWELSFGGEEDCKDHDPGAILIPCFLWQAVSEAHPLAPMRLAALCRVNGEANAQPEAYRSCRWTRRTWNHSEESEDTVQENSGRCYPLQRLCMVKSGDWIYWNLLRNVDITFFCGEHRVTVTALKDRRHTGQGVGNLTAQWAGLKRCALCGDEEAYSDRQRRINLHNHYDAS
jgi:hypothetical protein